MRVTQEDIDRAFASWEAEKQEYRREYLKNREREMLRSPFLRLALALVLCGAAVYGVGAVLRAVLP